jgi:hypothetical protein
VVSKYRPLHLFLRLCQYDREMSLTCAKDVERLDSGNCSDHPSMVQKLYRVVGGLHISRALGAADYKSISEDQAEFEFPSDAASFPRGHNKVMVDAIPGSYSVLYLCMCNISAAPDVLRGLGRSHSRYRCSRVDEHG